jgi:hypothetical protein
MAAYNLTRFNGTTQVPDNQVTTIAGITLPGKNYLGYGQIVDQALLNMVENFAGPTPGPSNPIIGQLWFDTGNLTMRCYDGNATTAPVWSNIAKGNATGWSTNLVASNANVKISGGLAGQFLTTNGSGSLSWSSTLPSPTTITNITTGAVANPGTITGNWTLTAGSRLQATYADLAERHHADAEYTIGTVMTVGGENEITVCQVNQTAIGVVSDKYAYLMNSEAGPDETHPAVGYLGRVHVKVIGPITKHQRIAPAGNGQATVADKNSFGWALESNNEVGEKLVLCLIK